MKNFYVALLGVALCSSGFVPPVLAQAAPLAAPVGEAKPLLHPLFSDNAVLQRDRVIPIWGWAAPGQSVTVRIGMQIASARADLGGRWMVRVGPFAATRAPVSLEASAAGGEVVSRRNIVFGDVWLCAGQSNMEMGIGQVLGADREIESANYPLIRLLTVPKLASGTPQERFKAAWLVCDPTNIIKGNGSGFSAAGYFFGRKVHQETGVPIGLIQAGLGGTPAEAWASESALNTLPEFSPVLQRLKEAKTLTTPFEEQLNAWWQQNDQGTRALWQGPDTDLSAWKTLTLPGFWEDKGFADFDGIAWLRRDIEVPADWQNQNLTLNLGSVDDWDTTFWNGVPIGHTQDAGQRRRYTIPRALIKERNTLAVRVYDRGGRGGVYGFDKPNLFRLERDATHSIPLAGNWQFRLSAPRAQLSPAPLQIGNSNPNLETTLYNGMIAPLASGAIKGVLWYQGESNVGRAQQYNRLLPALILDWRQRFGSPDAPFYIVQLANFMAPDETPRDDGWPRLREAQLQIATSIPQSGLAVTTDIGDPNDIHPRNKQDVGLRLALIALAKDYGRNVEFSGPTLRDMKVTGDTVRLRFDHASGGLKLQGEAARVFAIAGRDKKFVWATPAIEGDAVVLRAPEVREPVAVRFGWSNSPRANLFNGTGLPASPFRTDSW